ncbi:MAG: transketolase [Planctomycetia bacterium]|nr:transketolase [Planctomycetia bacterium]
MSFSMNNNEKKAIDTIRALSMDGVQKANSGHPGTAMALAPITYLLYNERMQYDPRDPRWLNRDRFILSIGHASMLLYSTLHVAGVCNLGANGEPTDEPAVRLDDIKSFRQLGSRCAGHPEYGHVAGVEMTTGPLGAGVATSVGMAMGDRWLANRYNKEGFPLFNANVYALCGDGDMMEGISAEAVSLAGHLQLSNLCWIYDANRITIEGATDLAFTEDVKSRFLACRWNVLEVDDANDLPQLRRAFDSFKAMNDRPTLILVHSRIAFGAPTKEGTSASHGAPLGDEEIRGAKQNYGLNPDESFAVEESVYQTFRDGLGQRGAKQRSDWNALFEQYEQAWPELAAELRKLQKGDLPDDWNELAIEFPADEKGMASRASSGKVLNAIAPKVPWFLGGSADLAPSNCTEIKLPEAGAFSPTGAGRNIHFGVRENAMAAATNGLVLCGLRAYCATFFVFADYLRPMIRLAALMRIPTLFIFTHDSIGVGEDGPTHQPVEHLASLRAIPNLTVLRPCDANEVAQAYKIALQSRETPTVIVLTRQNLPTLDRSVYAPANLLAKGGYILAEAETGQPSLILAATGSEVPLCLAAQKELQAKGIPTRVVSMPSWELFEQQPSEWRNEVLPPNVPTIAVEMGVEQGWSRYTGNRGRFIGMTGFGASGPAKTLFEHFGFTVANIVKQGEELLASN